MAQKEALEELTNSSKCKLLKISEREEILKIIDKIKPVEIVPELQCCQCDLILIYHRILRCGHKLCKWCCDIMLLDQVSYCPICRAEVGKNSIRQSSDVDLKVHKLNVYCIYRQNGCRSTTTVAELNMHLKQCRFSTRALLPKVYAKAKVRHFDLQVEEKLTEIFDSVKTLQQKYDKVETENKTLKEQLEISKEEFAQTIKTITNNVGKVQLDIKEFQEEFELTEQRKNAEITQFKSDMELKLEEEILKTAVENEKLLKETISETKKEWSERLQLARESAEVKQSLLEIKFERTIDEVKKLNFENAFKLESEFEQKLETLDFNWSSTLNNESQRLSNEMDKIKTEFEAQSIILENRLNKDFILQLRAEKSNIFTEMNESSAKMMNSLKEEFANVKSELLEKIATETENVKQFSVDKATQCQEKLLTKILNLEQELAKESFTYMINNTNISNKEVIEILIKKNMEDMTRELQMSMKTLTNDLNKVKLWIIKLNLKKQLLKMRSEFPIEWIEEINQISNAHLKLTKDDDMMRNVSESLSFLKPFELLWKVTSFKRVLQELINGKHVESEWFLIANWGLKVKALLTYISGRVYVSLLFSNEDGSKVTRDSLLDLNECTFVLIDQKDGTDHVIVSAGPEFNTTGNKWINQGYNKWFFDPKLFEEFKNRFVKDDSISIRVELLPLIPVFLQPNCSYDGTLEWKITEFGKKREMEINGLKRCSYSESFYSWRAGYRMKAKIYLNGCLDAKGQWISVYVCFLRGQFDEDLPPHFKRQTTFKIVHPNDSKKNISKQTKDFINNLAEITEILKGGYLENDTLAIKIEVVIEK